MMKEEILNKVTAKDKTLIPHGDYCYSGNKICPYRTNKEVGHNDTVLISYCSYLEQGDISDLSKEEFKLLKNYHNMTDEELWEEYPLDVLWDSVKECGVNDEYEDLLEDDRT